MSYSKNFYLSYEEPYEDEDALRVLLNTELKSIAKGAPEALFEGFSLKERRVLKRLISSKEPAHKIAKRLRLSVDEIMTLLFKAVESSKRLEEEFLALTKPNRRPCYGCGHPIVNSPKDNCSQCIEIEIQEALKRSLNSPVIHNLHSEDLDAV
jgi:hypothetical protein